MEDSVLALWRILIKVHFWREANPFELFCRPYALYVTAPLQRLWTSAFALTDWQSPEFHDRSFPSTESIECDLEVPGLQELTNHERLEWIAATHYLQGVDQEHRWASVQELRVDSWIGECNQER